MYQKSPHRTKRKQEIQFRKAFFRFSIAFVFVLVMGLISRAMIQNIPLQEKLSQTSKSPEGYTLEFTGASFQFHSGWVPVLAVHIPRITIAETKCASNILRVQNFLMIFDFIKLIQGKVEPSRVLVDYLEGNHYQVCLPDDKDSQAGPEDNDKTPQKVAINQKIKNKTSKMKSLKSSVFQSFYKNLWPEIKKFPIYQLNIKEFAWNEYLKINEKLHISGKAKIWKNESFHVEFELNQASLKNELLDSLYAKGNLEVSDDGVTVALLNKVREGELSFRGQLERKKNWPVELGFKIKRLPISALSTFFEDLKISYLWASCSGSLKSDWQKLWTENIALEKCEVNGPYGQIQVKSLQANLSEWKKFELEVSKLELDEVLKEKRDLHFSGVLAEYGMISGQVAYQNDNYNIRGHLENSQILFSNSNLRDVQKIKKLPFEIQGNLEHWKAMIKEVELEDGEFSGDIQMESTHSSKNAKGRIAIHRLMLSQRIYKLMLQSEPAHLRVYGKFSMSEGKVNDWSALLATPELNSDSYSLKNLKVKGEMKSKELSQVNINVSEGFLKKATPFLAWIRPTHLDSDWEADRIEFQELSTRLDLFADKKVEWSRGYVRLKNGWQLSSEGTRLPNREVVAWLQWDRPRDRKFLKWNFKGPFFKGQWFPETPWVREWLVEHPNFVDENKSISMEPFLEENLPKNSLLNPAKDKKSREGV